MDGWGGFWILILFAAIGAGFILQYKREVDFSNKKIAMYKAVESLPDFSSTQEIIGNNAETGLAIDEDRKKIVLITNGPSGVDLKPITYRDLLSSEIFVDGETVTKTARGSQLGGALIGGLALGGVGAVIGGLSGAKRSTETVKRIDLRVSINDPKSPFHDINFMDPESEKDGIENPHESPMDQARHWHGLIGILIRMADSEDIQNEVDQSSTKETAQGKPSLADELSKLSDLRDKGVLSDEEFEIQKQRLLS